jgi:hypothetical protein
MRSFPWQKICKEKEKWWSDAKNKKKIAKIKLKGELYAY